MDASQSIEKQDQPIHKITRDTESPRDTQPHITVYKNYIPLCFLGLAGFGTYIYSHWKCSSADNSAESRTVDLTPATQEKERDPFDF